MAVDFHATATFIAWGKLAANDRNHCDPDDNHVRFETKGGRMPLSFLSADHLNGFQCAHRVLRGFSTAPICMRGEYDLARDMLIPHSIKPTDVGGGGCIVRAKLKPVKAMPGELSCGCVFAGPDEGQDNWPVITNKLVSPWLRQMLKVAESSVATVGQLFDGNLIYCRAFCVDEPHKGYLSPAAAAAELASRQSASGRKRKARPKRSVSLRTRMMVITRDGHTCRKCGASPLKDNSTVLHVDHVIPVSRGGSCHPENLQTLCEKCNLGKGNMMEIDLGVAS